MTSAFEISIVRSVAELDALIHAWDRLAARFETPLLDHDWFASAVRTLHDESDLRVMILTEGDEVTGIAPMVLDRQAQGRLVLIGAGTLFEPAGWLYSSLEALETLSRSVMRLGRPALLQRLPATSELVRDLSSALRGRAIVVHRRASDGLAVETAGGWNEYRARIGGRAARKLRSMWTRARREQPDLRVTIAPLALPDEADEALARFVSLEVSGWKGRQGSALSHRMPLKRFFSVYLRTAAERGRLWISTLDFGSALVAMEIAVRAYGRHWTLKIAYDERFAAYGPGVLLTDASIAAALDARLDGYEFLGAAEPWQERWAPSRHQHVSSMVYPLTTTGASVAVADVTDFVWRRLRRRHTS